MPEALARLFVKTRMGCSALNPTGNFNRLRLFDYKNIFGQYFQKVDIHVIGRLEKEFHDVQSRACSGFLKGDTTVDSLSLIPAIAEKLRATAAL